MALRNRKLILAYQRTFEGSEGQQVLADLRKLCVAFDRPVTCDDPLTMARLMGEANVVKHIFMRLKQDPNAVEARPVSESNVVINKL